MGDLKITEGMTFDDYREIPAVHWSTLKCMADSAAHYKYREDNPLADTVRLAMGRAVHTAVLEPDRFPLDYVVFDGPRRAGKKWEEFAEANDDKTILRADEYDKCIAVRDAVHAHELAASLLYGKSEVVLEWTDGPTGIKCKARADHINADGELLDLKTTGSVDGFDFERISARMLYHCQLAFYRRGFGTEHRPRIIAAEIDEPHDVAVFKLTDDALYAGDQHIDEMLRRLAMYREADVWPGRYATEQELTIPQWMLDDDGDTGYGFTIGDEAV